MPGLCCFMCRPIQLKRPAGSRSQRARICRPRPSGTPLPGAAARKWVGQVERVERLGRLTWLNGLNDLNYQKFMKMKTTELMEAYIKARDAFFFKAINELSKCNKLNFKRRDDGSYFPTISATRPGVFDLLYVRFHGTIECYISNIETGEEYWESIYDLDAAPCDILQVVDWPK